MLDRAEDLAKILCVAFISDFSTSRANLFELAITPRIPCFDTPSGLPYSSIKLGRPSAWGSVMRVSLAEGDFELFLLSDVSSSC